MIFCSSLFSLVFSVILISVTVSPFHDNCSSFQLLCWLLGRRRIRVFQLFTLVFYYYLLDIFIVLLLCIRSK
uniref:Uncharacterized protein n=1 Tax=Octopus bimaculoides TaxID=37653 RepID=A0A0L8HDR5_OCTBM